MTRGMWIVLALAVGCQSLEQAEVADGEGEQEIASTSVGSTSIGELPTSGPADDDDDDDDDDSTSTGPGVGDDDDDSTSTGPGVGDDDDDSTSTGPDDDDDGDDDDDDMATSTGETDPEQSFPALSCDDESTLASSNGGQQVNVVFTNVAGEIRRAYWLNPGGNRVFLFEFDDGEQASYDTYVGHYWVFTNAQDECVTILEAVEEIGGMDHEIDVL